LAGHSWLAIVAKLAGPAIALAIHFGRRRKEPEAMDAALRKIRNKRAHLAEEMPRHWSHLISSIAFVGLPFAQWFAFLHYRSLIAFLVPLFIVIPIMLVVVALHPVARELRPLDQREWAVRLGTLMAVLIASLVMPSTGTILVFRGVLIDVLALATANYAMKVVQQGKQVAVPVS